MTLREPLDEAASTRGRVAVWFAVRALTPAAVLLAVAAAGVRPDTERLAWILTTQGAFALATHLLAAKARPAQSLVIWIGMIADVAAVGALVALTGGTAGPLVFLFTVHALAAGILLSSRAGLRSILLSTGAILVIDMIAAPAGTSGVALPSGAVAIAALWILGGTGTLFTTYNERELRRRNAELATIRRITLDIEGSLSLEEIFADLCAGVADAFRFDATAVLLRQGKHVRCVAAHGVTGAMGRTFVPSGRVAQALLCGTPTVTTTEEARADGGLEPILGESGYVAVPIAEGGLLVATRSGRQGGPGRVRESEIEALEGLAHHARLAVANARLHQRVATMAVTDPLTGLWNHGEMQRRLADEAGRLGRYTALRGSDHALSFMLMDIDHFKKLNDTYGHPAGDAVLKGVARAVRGAVREFDVVARYGGEEFAVILPETGVESAREVGERIRRAIAAYPFTFDGKHVRVTVSIGIATTAGSGITPAQLIEGADAALYRSKECGRNRITHTADPEAPVASVVAMEAMRRRRGPNGAPAPAGSRRAHGRSSHPTRRIPRA